MDQGIVIYSSEYLRELISELKHLRLEINHIEDNNERIETDELIKSLKLVLIRMLEDPSSIKRKMSNSLDPNYRKEMETLLKTREDEKEWFNLNWFQKEFEY